MRTLCVGDIHGGYKAFMDILEQSKFNYEEDKLICLGDVADGWPEVKECFNELLKIKNLVYILGNHDAWFLHWLLTDQAVGIWTGQGGANTLKSYNFQKDDRVIKLLTDALNYYIDEKNNLYIHGGYNWHGPIDSNSHFRGYHEMAGRHSVYNWDRYMWETAIYHQTLVDKGVHKFDDLKVKDYNKVFIGHTTTQRSYPDLKPAKAMNVINLDQGGGWSGKLSIMDVNTEEYWQSKHVREYYPNEKGRG